MNQFVIDRDNAYRSLDRALIEKFYLKYKIPYPFDDRSFWKEVHKARVSNPNMTEDEKQHSIQWLHKHGFGRGKIFKSTFKY